MACFIVPGAEAVVTTVITKVVEKQEEKLADGEVKFDKAHFSNKLKTLNCMLWGGSALLAFEHIWHGEIQLVFPFLTAASNPADFAEMVHEMSTVGVSMAVLVTAAWGVGTYISSRITRKQTSIRKVENR